MNLADVSEIVTLGRDLDLHSREVKGQASKVVRRTAFAIVASGQADAPVDTGATRDSIHASAPSGGSLSGFSLEAEIGPTTEYAPYPHDGTSRIPPNPYMDRAADKHTPEFVEGLTQIGDGL